ncbi:bifunctional diguanylate cyclase/phosphodiesterase [Paenibacillus donghaensis]|uniref:Diguanylate cyclase n=1 Tax=Paenibacillus donghaensis TaxID=414771 RepID=A0A2Z2KFN6_9BACL|nr:EAL domain-containing protein [Paenibacillus donghaensis]ASA24617.1 hypothetical protein B9T62_30010 [Paenibacillus donghaensis]
MKLRKKIVIFISVVASIALISTYLLLHLFLLNRFDKLDQDAIHSKLKEAVYAYQVELQSMQSKLMNYSVWDDTYQFAAVSPETAAEDPYINNNYIKSTFEINHFDMVALLNNAGEELYGGSYNSQTRTIDPLPEELHTLVGRIHSSLQASPDLKNGKAGIVLLDQGPMLISLAAIVNNDMSQPSRGIAIAGRLLRDDEMKQINQGTSSILRITRISPAQLQAANNREFWLTTGEDNSTAIHKVVNNLFGEPDVVISVKQPRRIYESGLESIFSFLLFFFLLTVLIFIVCLIFVNRAILQRVVSLVDNIRTIASSQHLSIRINSSGKDEFSEVEHEFNRMMSSLEHSQEELQLQSMLDPLTKLPNRSLFFTRLNEAIEAAQASGRKIALVFIDLDHFKTVNDTFGHEYGDTLLKEISDRMLSVVGNQDVVSRLGSDEFTILLADLPDAHSIELQLARVQEALLAPHLIHGHVLHNTASIGVSVFPDNGMDADILVKQADLAMLYVKESGRNHMYQYSEALEESVRRNKILALELLSAADNHELEVYYQPILSSDTMKVSKVEALLRWTSSTYGAVPPSEFIPLAESSGSIVAIGSHVLRQVCADMVSFRSEGFMLSAAVNISAVQLMQPGLLEILLELLEEFALPASSLELEITESVLVSGDNISQSLQQLREHGFRISLDDFGTGFSSLSYLRRFPVDVIKIDRSFVSEITLEQPDDVLVKAIIELSHNLGLRVVSEGIELKEQFDLLRRLGSDELQGYYISRPIRAAEIPAFLAQTTPNYDK